MLLVLYEDVTVDCSEPASVQVQVLKTAIQLQVFEL